MDSAKSSVCSWYHFRDYPQKLFMPTTFCLFLFCFYSKRSGILENGSFSDAVVASNAGSILL